MCFISMSENVLQQLELSALTVEASDLRGMKRSVM